MPDEAGAGVDLAEVLRQNHQTVLLLKARLLLLKVSFFPRSLWPSSVRNGNRRRFGVKERIIDGPPEDEVAAADSKDRNYVELLKENRVLNQLIRQYEATLEVVMSKFRAQTSLIQREKKVLQDEWHANLLAARAENDSLRKENILLSEQLEESMKAIRQALQADEYPSAAAAESGVVPDGVNGTVL
ncbi:hypothetical protein HDU96_005846 [Phlyctochytrium bullatum]|nr:hypothetical protein HDU96_005846 [Phlyctochytrium bullatum]